MWLGWKEVAWLVPWLGDSRSFRKGCSLQFQLLFQKSYNEKRKEIHRPSSEDGGQRHQGSAAACTPPTMGTDCSGFICWRVLLYSSAVFCLLWVVRWTSQTCLTVIPQGAVEFLVSQAMECANYPKESLSIQAVLCTQVCAVGFIVVGSPCFCYTG